jgi:hypothetical protein
MARFGEIKTVQKFPSAHASIHNHFNHDRHLSRRAIFEDTPARPHWPRGDNYRPDSAAPRLSDGVRGVASRPCVAGESTGCERLEQLYCRSSARGHEFAMPLWGREWRS